MQEMTSAICSAEVTPTASAATPTTSHTTAESDNTTYVPEAILEDTRDGKSYRVRKLADGNCWMAENLRLSLNTDTPLTSETSDINYNMDTGEGVDGSTTTPRTITNPLKLNGPVLGTYSTGSDGVISWTPYVSSQYGTSAGTSYNVAWGSAFSDCSDSNGDGKIIKSECTLATSGTQEGTGNHYFAPNTTTGAEENVTPSGNWYVNNNALAEFARSYDNENGRSSGTTMNDGDGLPQYYGTYFNWYAATAGSGTWALSNGDAQNSVCPRNWSLPKNDGDGSWYDLFYTNYSFTATTGADAATEITAFQKTPFSIIRSAFYYWESGTIGYRDLGLFAMYWSSSTLASTNAHFLASNPGGFYPQSDVVKPYGVTVRCVVR